MTALLMLEDGSLFRGSAIGAPGMAVGEVVFNTAMTGYQEILTDPSYARQIVTLTYPHIGNTGVNAEDTESARIWAAGLVIRDCPTAHSKLARRGALAAVLGRRGRGGHRRLGHPPAHPLDPREGRHGRLHRRGGRRRPGCGAGRSAGVSRSGRNGLGESRVDVRDASLGRRRLGVGGGLSGGECRARPPRGGVRLRRQAQHPQNARGPRLSGDSRAGRDPRRRGLGTVARWRVPFQRTRRPRTLRLRHPSDPRRARTATCPCSAFASATSCWRSPAAARR